MKQYKAIIATSRMNRHKEIMPVEVLQKMVEQINSQYSPVGIEHDPRIPPVGRLVSAKLNKLEDGEYEVEASFELPETKDEVIIDKNDPREIKIDKHSLGLLDIKYDRNYRNKEDREIIDEINYILNTHKIKPLESIKNSMDPISVITIGGAFVLGGVFNGFFGQIGADAYVSLKNKLTSLFKRNKEGEKDKLLIFDFTVSEGEFIFAVEIILSNPDEDEIDNFLISGIKELDKIIPHYALPGSGLKHVVIEYKKGIFIPKYGILKNGFPVSIK